MSKALRFRGAVLNRLKEIFGNCGGGSEALGKEAKRIERNARFVGRIRDAEQ